MKPPRLTEFQQRCIAAIKQGLNEQAHTGDVVHRVKSNNLAVTAALKSLEKAGMIGQFTMGGQWATRTWFITAPARSNAAKTTSTRTTHSSLAASPNSTSEDAS